MLPALMPECAVDSDDAADFDINLLPSDFGDEPISLKSPLKLQLNPLLPLSSSPLKQQNEAVTAQSSYSYSCDSASGSAEQQAIETWDAFWSKPMDASSFSDDCTILCMPTAAGARGKRDCVAWQNDFIVGAVKAGVLRRTNVVSTTAALEARNGLPSNRLNVVQECFCDMKLSYSHETKLGWIVPGLRLMDSSADVCTFASFFTIAAFDTGSKKLANVRIYWDQAGVLLRLGLVQRSTVSKAWLFALHPSYLMPIFKQHPRELLALEAEVASDLSSEEQLAEKSIIANTENAKTAIKIKRRQESGVLSFAPEPIATSTTTNAATTTMTAAGVSSEEQQETPRMRRASRYASDIPRLNLFIKALDCPAPAPEVCAVANSASSAADENKSAQTASRVFDDTPLPVNAFSGIVANPLKNRESALDAAQERPRTARKSMITTFDKPDLNEHRRVAPRPDAQSHMSAAAVRTVDATAESRPSSSIAQGLRKDLVSNVFQNLKQEEIGKAAESRSSISESSSSSQGSEANLSPAKLHALREKRSSVFQSAAQATVPDKSSEVAQSHMAHHRRSIAREKNESSSVFARYSESETAAQSAKLRQAHPHEQSSVFDKPPPARPRAPSATNGAGESHIVFGDDGGSMGLAIGDKSKAKGENKDFAAGVGKPRPPGRITGGGKTTIQLV